MPSSVVHAGFAFIVAVGLLGTYYDRRALVVLVGVLLVPEADTLAGLVLEGAHRALLHNLLLPAIVAPVLYWDTTREDSWLRDRFGGYGVRLAWVGLFVHAFAHVGLDWYHLDGVNLFYPLVDRFFELDGEASLSTAEGFVQTFVEVGTDPATGAPTVDAGQGGTTNNTHVANPAQPSKDPEPGPLDRRAPIAVQGWQLFLVVAGLFTVAAKHVQGSPPEAE
jgi:hypothetical protein